MGNDSPRYRTETQFNGRTVTVYSGTNKADALHTMNAQSGVTIVRNATGRIVASNVARSF